MTSEKWSWTRARKKKYSYIERFSASLNLALNIILKKDIWIVDFLLSIYKLCVLLYKYFDIAFCIPRKDYWIVKSRHISYLAPKVSGENPPLFGVFGSSRDKKYIYEPFVEVNNGDVIVDVGAFIGIFTILYANKASKVISIEPDPRNYMYLKKNTENLNNVTLVKSPLWKDDVKLEFKLSYKPVDSSIIDFDSDLKRGILYVQAKRLDTLFFDLCLDKIDFLKIDVEGAEPEVLEGAEKIQNKIKKIAVDCTPERHGKSTISQVQKIVKKWGFNYYTRSYILYAWRDK